MVVSIAMSAQSQSKEMRAAQVARTATAAFAVAVVKLVWGCTRHFFQFGVSHVGECALGGDCWLTTFTAPVTLLAPSWA